MAQAKVIELALVKDPVAEINELHQKICLAAKTTIEDAMRIGELLTEQRKHCGRGNWLSWIEANLSFSHDSARNYIRVFDKKSELRNVRNLTDAYRIVLPKKHKPSKPKQPSSMVLQLLGGAQTCEITDPLPSWHAVSQISDPASQIVVCTKCWHYSSGTIEMIVTKKASKFGDIRTFQCHCADSERTGTVTQVQKEKK